MRACFRDKRRLMKSERSAHLLDMKEMIAAPYSRSICDNCSHDAHALFVTVDKSRPFGIHTV